MTLAPIAPASVCATSVLQNPIIAILATRNMRTAVHELEKGAARPLSGNGFADDLAVLLSGRAEFFTEDLLLATSLGAASLDTIAAAELDCLEGKAVRRYGDWEESVVLFGKAIRKLEKEIALGSLPCSP